MPGLTQTRRDDDQERSNSRLKGRAPRIEPARVPRVADGRYDSYAAVNHRVRQTTGYGVNEPQWTEGPPPVIYRLSPYARVPLPPMFHNPIPLHEFLSVSNSPYIGWSIDTNPDSATLISVVGRRNLYCWKALAATEVPDVLSLTIIVKPFPTPIVVRRITGADGPITILDILTSVYRSIRRDTEEAFQALGGSALASLNAPFPHSASMTNDPLSSSVRDFLKHETMWGGLEPSPTETDVWILRTMPLYQR